MSDEAIVRDTVRAIETARAAWERANRDLPQNPMTRTAAIPATGILAAAMLDEPDADADELAGLAEQAVAIARRAWERTHVESPGNPIAATAERSVIGIVAAGVLKRLLQRESTVTPVTGPDASE